MGLDSSAIIEVSPPPVISIVTDDNRRIDWNIEMKETLEQWQSNREEHRNKFIAAFINSEERRVEYWNNLLKHDNVVFRLAESFAESSDQIDSFLDLGWEVARKRIIFGGSVIPSENQANGWAFELWEQLNLYHQINIDDLMQWTEECQIHWAG